MSYRIDKKRFYCKKCNENVIGERSVKSTNHILHLLLSIFTLGCWIPIWILMFFNFYIGGYKCTKCASSVSISPKKELDIVSDNKFNNLSKLSELLEKGLLTEEEFKIEKNKILN